MIQIPLTPEKYMALLKRLMDLRPPDVDYLQLPTGTNPGQIVNPQITLDFTYNGKDTLNVTIIKKHGPAIIVSDGIIKAHLIELLTGV